MTTSGASPECIDEFVSSLPASYRDRHSREVIAVHARVAAERGASPANVGRFVSTRGQSAACVVAEDRPGLLSRITAAFVMQGWDIVNAEAYIRPLPMANERALDDRAGELEPSDGARSSTKSEAVDLFWLRRLPGPSTAGRGPALDDGDVQAIRTTLLDLLEGRVELPDCITSKEPAEVHNTRVRFIEGDDGQLCTLEVETRDRSGLLLVLTRALAAQRVTITRSEVRTFSTRVFDRFTIAEFDGSPIGAARRLQIQVAVLSAIETPFKGPAQREPVRERRAQGAR